MQPEELRDQILALTEVWHRENPPCGQCGGYGHETRYCKPIEEAWSRLAEVEAEMWQWRAMALAYYRWMESHPNSRASFERQYLPSAVEEKPARKRHSRRAE